MLTEEEKAKILHEEIYRNEIRKEIKSKGNKYWNFFNSPFGLWFLGTIAIGIITWSYSNIQIRLEQQKNLAEKVNKLDTEIFERLYEYDVQIRSIVIEEYTEYGNTFKIEDGNIKKDILKIYSRLLNIPENLSLSNGRIIPSSGIFQEYSNRTTKGLMIELSTYVSSKEKEEIQRKVDFMEFNYVVFTRGSTDLKTFYDNTTNLYLDRWSNKRRPSR